MQAIKKAQHAKNEAIFWSEKLIWKKHHHHCKTNTFFSSLRIFNRLKYHVLRSICYIWYEISNFIVNSAAYDKYFIYLVFYKLGKNNELNKCSALLEILFVRYYSVYTLILIDHWHTKKKILHHRLPVRSVDYLTRHGKLITLPLGDDGIILFLNLKATINHFFR